jgi:hypothetical protein
MINALTTLVGWPDMTTDTQTDAAFQLLSSNTRHPSRFL